MPPRRAKGKPRSTRMDAACDNLARMGFRREDVRKNVNRLLKVYGQDAWVFLEEDGYKLVIETMIEEQEAGTGEPPQLDHRPHEEHAEPLKVCVPVNGTCVGEAGISHECLVEQDTKMLTAPDISENSEFSSRNSECSGQGIVPDQRHNGGESYRLLAHGYLIRSRPACYGWISEDEAEMDDDEHPYTASEKRTLGQSSLNLEHDRKRKSRCDMKPNNI